MIELDASQSYGGGKPYLARITGTHPKFGLERSFLAARTQRSKSGSTCSVSAKVTEPGLYEECDTNRKGKESRFWFLGHIDRELRAIKVREETAYEIAEAFESGRKPAELWITRDAEGKLTLRPTGPDGPLDWIDTTTETRVPDLDPHTEALAEIRRLMDAHGITAADLAAEGEGHA